MNQNQINNLNLKSIKELYAYFGPVQPIVVPKPPLSFNTTSLSKRFFISKEPTPIFVT